MKRQILEGHIVRIRPIIESDVAFMVNIRNKPENNRYLSNRDQTITIESQKEWMAKRYESIDSIDFIIEIIKDNRPVGCMAIYDIVKEGAEFGRYIVENPMGAIEGELLGLRYAFDILNLDKIYCKTVQKNIKVWNQHTKLGFTHVGLDFDSRIQETRVLQSITKENFANFDYSAINKLLKRFA